MITYSEIQRDGLEMDVDLSWALERRKHFLSCEITLYKEAISKLLGSLAGKDLNNRSLIFHWMNEYEDSIKIRKREIAGLKPLSNDNSKESITDVMISQAKEYPIENLLSNQVKNNITNCVSHDDKNPSMSIKNNRACCFSCGFKGDSIDVYMTLYNVSFKLAVERMLNGG